jgi:hypothetical protein
MEDECDKPDKPVLKNQSKESISDSITEQPSEQPKLNDSPTQVTCVVCHAKVLSETNYKNGVLTWVVCSVLCLLG